MKVTITGIDDVIKMNEKLSKPDSLVKSADELIQKTAMLIRRYAPRKTGDLENSIIVIKKSKNIWDIVITVPYAYYMEYGTRYFPVGDVNAPRARTSSSGKPCFHPFMRPAVWQMMRKYPDILKRALFR